MPTHCNHGVSSAAPLQPAYSLPIATLPEENEPEPDQQEQEQEQQEIEPNQHKPPRDIETMCAELIALEQRLLNFKD